MKAFTWECLSLNLINPFSLSYGVSTTRQGFWLRLANDAGWGEATIPPYYHVDPGIMTAFWQQKARSRRPLPEDPQEIAGWVGIEGPSPARCALELALYDRIARQASLPLYTLLGLPRPEPKPTSFTISMDTPAAMARLAIEIQNYPVIKLKLGSDDDEACLAAVRAARPDARLRVDANAGWSRSQAAHMLVVLERYDLEMIEQPLEKEDLEGLGWLQKQTNIPIVADESLQCLADLETLARSGVKAINLKLMKLGGLSPAVRVLKRAHELGMGVMLGCMIETSLGTTAMAHLMGLAEWIDLDAPLLIANDPFEGVHYNKNADVLLPERAGIGVILKPAY